MGKLLSCCIRCFPGREESQNPNEEMSLLTQPPAHPYSQEQQTLPTLSSLPESSFSINLDAQLAEARARLVAIRAEHYEEDHGFSETENGVLFRYRWTVPATLEQVQGVLEDYQNRKDWDSSLVQCEIAGQVGEISVVYMQFQQSLLHAGRDQLLALQSFPLQGASCIVGKSTASPAYPVKVNVIRSNLPLVGFYLEQAEQHTQVDYVLEVHVSKAIPREELVRQQLEAMRLFAHCVTTHASEIK